MTRCFIFTAVFSSALIVAVLGYLPEFEVVLSEAELMVGRIAALDQHNLRRCMHNAPPLALDLKLNLRAQDYAERLARERRYDHSRKFGEKMGENLQSYYILGPSLNASDQMASKTEAFYREVDAYNDPDSTGRTGHFTAVVWKATKLVGIGLATTTVFLPDYPGYPKTQTYIVANYKPAGNVQGEGVYEENVEGHPSKTEDECRRILKELSSGSGRCSVPIGFWIFSPALLLLTAWL